jgi:hypothetical protein
VRSKIEWLWSFRVCIVRDLKKIVREELSCSLLSKKACHETAAPARCKQKRRSRVGDQREAFGEKIRTRIVEELRRSHDITA